MSLSVADALRDGLGRTFERNGLALVAVFVAVRLASAVATNTLNRATFAFVRETGAFPGDAPGGLPGLAETPTPFALGLGLGAGVVLVLVVAVVAEAVRIVAVRTLVSDRVDAIPAEYRRRNIVGATLNGFVGGIVVGTLVVLGLILLIVPGVFLAVSFLFVRQEIAVRDVNFVDAMAGSWSLTAGDRLALFALVLVLFLVNVVAAVPSFAAGAASPAAGVLVGALIQAAVAVFAVATVSRAYVQLREGPDEPEPEADPYAGALTADDLPPPESHERR